MSGPTDIRPPRPDREPKYAPGTTETQRQLQDLINRDLLNMDLKPPFGVPYVDRLVTGLLGGNRSKMKWEVTSEVMQHPTIRLLPYETGKPG